jgi:4'-phosphopantetheinyl transferase EntD
MTRRAEAWSRALGVARPPRREAPVLFPEGVAFELDFGDSIGGVFEAERRLVATASPARQVEFGRGRAAAHRALGQLGWAPQAIGRTAARGPSWPAGVVGSISHGAGWATAAVARSDAFAGLGVDVEAQGRISPDLLTRITTADERDRIEALVRLRPRDWATVIWCAKEAVFKCLHPSTGVFLDFADLSVGLDGLTGDFSLAEVSPRGRTAGAASVRGRFWTGAGRVLAAAWAAHDIAVS